MTQSTDLDRRRLLVGGAGVLAAAGVGGCAAPPQAAAPVAAAPTPQAPAAAAPPTATAAATAQAKPLPPYVSWKHADSVVVHTATTIETRRTAFGSSVVTPLDRLYIRNNLPAPDVSIVADRDGWQVAVEGVRQPRTLKVAELKTLGIETTTTVLQCSGNGRSYFPSKPSGTRWTVGAAGCVIWSGVPVRAVAEALGGVADGMLFMTGTGGEKLPEGLDPKAVVVERSVPLKAMEDALLAWELNGEPVPHAHGGPLRLVVPGYSGINNIKYIKRLAFTPAQTDAAIQRTNYRMSAPGQKGDPSQPAVWEMDVKSWINSPAPEAGPVRAGVVQVHGVAMGGMNAAARVEVSTDGGRSWQDARFVGPDLGRYAWRQFVLPVKLAPGSRVLACRATDTKGHVQVETTPDNGGGYLNSGWRAHALQITVA